MMTEIEHPEIRYVVWGVRRADGTRNGEPPKKRHDRDCTHYNFRGGKRWGTFEEATGEQMRTLEAWTTCVRKHAKSR
jgi:hypothetical protein